MPRPTSPSSKNPSATPAMFTSSHHCSLELHLSQELLDAPISLQRHLVQDRGKRANLDRSMLWNRHRVLTRCLAFESDMGSPLSDGRIADTSQSLFQVRTANIARQFHAGTSRMRSSSMWRRIRPGFRDSPSKWQVTASLTIASKSSQESPCVAIRPSGRRQSAVNPPSSAGRTRNTNSRSFIS